MYGNNHFSGAVIYNLVKGKLLFLVITYKKGNKTSIKFPGGCGDDGQEDQPGIVTLTREIREEIGCELVDTDVICISELTVGNNHTKRFFLIDPTQLLGECRDQSMKDGDEILGPPFWLEATELKRCLFPSHQPALLKAIKHLAGAYKEAAWLLCA